MLKRSQHLLEFEANLEGVTYQFRLVRFARLFWLERVDLTDWLAYFNDGTNQLQKFFNSSDKANLKIRAQRDIKKQRLSRAFAWDNDERFFITWKSNDHFWLDSDSLELHIFIPQTPFPEGPHWTATGDFFRQRFERECQNPECDARDALNYLLASPQERLCYAIRWVQGGVKEIERVVSAAMKIEFQNAITVSQEPDAAHMRGVTWVRVNSSQPYTFSERFHRLFAVIDERNVRYAFDAYTHQGRGSISVEVSISDPSMHAKIEARRFLREWLREHAPQLLPDWT